ncbi:hypothetical protein HJC23_009122 [Cyclotella cryptica]|uniref:Uncharacterized protein n=1 Tax=Cyclotella cryptica TaxID=29204 RepID=A0ABD3P0F5_9STRA|eukprot:CCRYP_018742-RA/>CCRYP_018742-RA protein AED:0.25 eAED:0.25 QI:127/1/1/1/0.75/0.6/5/756/1026
MSPISSSSSSLLSPPDLVSSLDCPSPHLALQALSQSSHETAAELALQLSSLLHVDENNHGRRPAASSSLKHKKSTDAAAVTMDDSSTSRYPVPLPKLLRDAPRDAPKSAASRSSHPLIQAHLASESILHSLTKIATGGSSASQEMKSLESQRRQLDQEAEDIALALRIRDGVERASNAMNGKRYAEAAAAVRDVNAILRGSQAASGEGCSARAKELAGESTLQTHERTVDILKRGISVAYESAVQHYDLAGMSELTPLLGMVDMADMGVRLYLTYSKGLLEKEMSLEEVAVVALPKEEEKREEGMSRAAMRRRAEEEARKKQNRTVPQKLAKIYNAAVTHLRHHLPMVAYSLGEADGDAALVQLVHVEVESRVVDLLRACMDEKELGLTVRRADRVAGKIEDRYTAGGDGLGGSGEDGNTALANVIMGLGVAGEATLGGGSVDMATKRNASLKDDCGFTIEVGNLSDVDAALEEWALMLQHTESYERFLRHAVEEVMKARKMRFEQKREERRRFKEAEEAKKLDAGEVIIAGRSPRKSLSGSVGSERNSSNDEEEKEQAIEIMPQHTQLNEIAAELGGCYSSLERCLLLAGMQRAFIGANFPDETTFSPVANNPSYGPGSNALQTTLVEECLYAARRSTLRAFATGHTGTASAAANVCVDVIGRVLLEVLSHRAELGASLLKPGEGLLAGQHGLGQAALSFAKSTAGKGLRGVQGAAVRAGASKGIVGDEETAAALRSRTMLGVARAAANFNDLEVVADYTKRLEVHFLKEIDAGYPRGHDTEQLRMCIKGLGGVVESFSQASDRSIERLVSTILPRVRQIVNDAVGQEGGSATTTASNFLGSPVLTGGNAAVASTHLDYNLDDQAFELSQISQGYMGRMCSELDEILEPLRIRLVPKLSDALLIGVLGGVSKRLEAAIRKSKFTPLGAISLDSDVRYLMSFAKDRIDSPELKSNVSLCKSCPALGRLNQIALLLNVDDLDDALDLISVNKRKGNWDLKLDDAKTLLTMRVDFEGEKVNDLLKVDE